MLIEFGGKRPRVHPTAFIAPTAVLIGDVEIGAGASVWYGAVLRADLGSIRVGAGSHVEDNCVIHGAGGHNDVVIEENCIIGHLAMLEGCRIGRGAVVGAKSTVFGGELGEGAMLAAGSVLPMGAKIPPRVLAAGVPAQVKKELSGESLWFVEEGAREYARLCRRYQTEARLLAE